jgi:predicted site-specific integrase-resolvase
MNATSRFVKLSKAAKFYNVSTRTIYRWRDSGQIAHIQNPSGQLLYKIGDVQKSETINIIYVRVSSNKQKDDLVRQKEYAHKQFPSHQIITDIGSGLNFKRPGLRRLLKLVSTGCVNEVVIASKDRLCRFGFELIEWICDENSTKLLVLDKDTGSKLSKESEFVRDILAIIQVYACKWNGSRRFSNESEKNKVEINITSKDDPKILE